MDTITHSRIKKMSPQLVVTDIDRSLEFYTKSLGFTVDFRYEDFYSGVVKDDCSIHLKLGEPSAEERTRRRSHTDLDIIFSVEGIENLYEEILAKFVTVIQPLREMPYGKEFYVADPDGYLISFLEGK